MGDRTHKTAVVVIPPEEVSPPIQAIRSRHDRHFRKWMPHITLIYPFRPVHEFETIGEHFEEVCARFEPFELELRTFKVFEHARRNCTLWLDPVPGERLKELQSALWQVVTDCDDVRRFPGEFVPHLSIGQVRGTEEAHRLLKGWQRTWKPIRFGVSGIGLIWREEPPDDIFRMGREVRLGG